MLIICGLVYFGDYLKKQDNNGGAAALAAAALAALAAAKKHIWRKKLSRESTTRFALIPDFQALMTCSITGM